MLGSVRSGSGSSSSIWCFFLFFDFFSAFPHCEGNVPPDIHMHAIYMHVGIHAFMHEEPQAWRGRSPALHQGQWQSSNLCTIYDRIKRWKTISKLTKENSSAFQGIHQACPIGDVCGWELNFTGGILSFAAGLGASNKLLTVQCRQHVISFCQSSHKAVKITHILSESLRFMHAKHECTCVSWMRSHKCKSFIWFSSTSWTSEAINKIHFKLQHSK